MYCYFFFAQPYVVLWIWANEVLVHFDSAVQNIDLVTEKPKTAPTGVRPCPCWNFSLLVWLVGHGKTLTAWINSWKLLALSAVIMSKEHKRTWIHKLPEHFTESLRLAKKALLLITSLADGVWREQWHLCVLQKAEARTVEVCCWNWWGVADEQMKLLARQSRHDGLTLKGMLYDIQHLDRRQ